MKKSFILRLKNSVGFLTSGFLLFCSNFAVMFGLVRGLGFQGFFDLYFCTNFFLLVNLGLFFITFSGEVFSVLTAEIVTFSVIREAHVLNQQTILDKQ